MSVTRAVLETMTRELADAVDDPRWSQTLVLQLLGQVHLQEWRDILNAANMRRYALRTVTTDANGRFAKTALDSGSGDTAETHYRLLSVAVGQFFYQQSQYADYPQPFQQMGGTLPNVWYEVGDEIQLVPLAQGTTVQVAVNHTPARVDQLAGDSSIVVYPDGYELILAYMGAKQMLLKGGIEGQYAAQLEAQAKQLRDRLLMDVRRLGTRPIIMGAMDSPAMWGG